MTELVTLKFRRGTTSEWTATTRTLTAGEPGFDVSTGVLKIGDGTSMWNNLPAFQASPILTETSSVALGFEAGTSGSTGSIAIGSLAGSSDQGVGGIAIGMLSGQTGQASYALSLGSAAGQTGQNSYAIAIGAGAGRTDQSSYAVSLGFFAGYTFQGQSSIAIGGRAGYDSQADNTIILNATGTQLNGVVGQTGSVYIAPVRNVPSGNYVINYDPTTYEMTYSEKEVILGGATGADGNTGATGPTGEGISLSGFSEESVLLSDGFGGVTSSSEFTFNTQNGISITAEVETNRLVMVGYGGAYYSDDYGDSWTPCTGTVPGYAAACSNSGVWIGANGSQVLTSPDGINWVAEFALAGAPGNDNKYGIGFNGNACVVGTVVGNVAFCSDVTATPQVWSSPAVQLTSVNIAGLAWNPITNRWWLFGSSGVSATVYTFDGVNTPTPLAIKDEFGNLIDLFTDVKDSDAWCMCGIQVGTSNMWIIGGKGPEQGSSLAILTPTTPSATEWSVLYEQTVTSGANYLRCLATDGTNILGGHSDLAIIRSPISNLDINSWINYSTVYARWVDLTYIGGYWFAGVGSPYNLGRSVMWSDTGIRWDLLYVGPGITTAYTVRGSPELIPGSSTVLASTFDPKRIGILTSKPYTTLDVRGTIASYTQYLNVGTSDNGLNLIKNNVASPASGTLSSAGVFSLDVPDPNVSVIEVLGSFRLTAPGGGTYAVLNVNSLGQLIFNSYTPGGTGITGPIMIAGPETPNV